MSLTNAARRLYILLCTTRDRGPWALARNMGYPKPQTHFEGEDKGEGKSEDEGKAKGKGEGEGKGVRTGEGEPPPSYISQNSRGACIDIG